MSTPGGPDDPTLMRNQPVLRTPRRRGWLIPGLLLVILLGVGTRG